MTEADTDRSLQLVLDQDHGTPIWRAAMLTNHALLPAVEMYQAFINDSHDKLRAAFELWKKQRWHAAVEPPKTALHAMHPRIQTYPSCCRFSSLFPVTTATPERSFSTLKRLKSYLRSSMGDDIIGADPRTCANDANQTCRSL